MNNIRSKIYYQKIRQNKVLMLERAGISLSEIRRLVEDESHAYGMIFDMIKRDYWNNELEEDFKLNSTKFTNFCKQNFIFLSKQNLDCYLEKPQWWKIQYRYPKNYSVAQIKEKIAEDGRRGFITAYNLRKKWPNYNKKNTIEWWTNQGLSETDAKEQIEKNNKSRSPYSVNFYLSRGFSEQEAKDKIIKLSIARGLKGLKKTQKPKTEKIVADVLNELQITFIPQYSIKLPKGYSLRRKSFVYDFFIPKYKTIIDCNGTYWHADPRKHAPDKIINLPGQNVTAKDIWKWDDERKIYAESIGMNFFVFWELDITHEFVKLEFEKAGFS